MVICRNAEGVHGQRKDLNLYINVSNDFSFEIQI